MLKPRIVAWAIAYVLFVGNAEAGDKMRIEVVETSSKITWQPFTFYAFANVILPDGSHARLMCYAGDGHCAKIAPISPEKMAPDSDTCYTVGRDEICTTTNLGTYEAERKGNELTIRAPKGKLKFKIVGSW